MRRLICVNIEKKTSNNNLRLTDWSVDIRWKPFFFCFRLKMGNCQKFLVRTKSWAARFGSVGGTYTSARANGVSVSFQRKRKTFNFRESRNSSIFSNSMHQVTQANRLQRGAERARPVGSHWSEERGKLPLEWPIKRRAESGCNRFETRTGSGPIFNGLEARLHWSGWKMYMGETHSETQ